TKLGLGFKEYIGLDEVCDLSTPSVFDPEPDHKEVKSLYESKSHLIKNCNVHDTVDNFPFVVSKAASVPAGSRNSSASISASRSIPAASRNKPTFIHAGKHIHVGRINKLAPFPADLICNGVPRTMVDLINLHGFALNDPQGRLKSMTGNKEKLDDFVQVKGGTITFRGGDGKITGKGTIRTSKLDFENVY
nr:hypothetical protein [Tanacetum cinerariifolium]